MPLPVRLAVIASAILFALASTSINFAFLTSLGRTPTEMMIFGGVSLAADFARLALPVVIGTALRAGRPLMAGIGLLMMVPVVALSLASGAGFAAATRGGIAAERATTTSLITELEKRLGELDRRRQAVVATGESGPLKAAMEVRNRDQRWLSSSQCAAPRGSEERRWCSTVSLLDVQLAAAQAREALDAERRRVAADLHTARSAQGIDNSEAQAVALSNLLALPPDLVRAGFTLGMAIVLELGSAVLAYLAAAPMGVHPAEGRAPAIKADEDIAPAPGTPPAPVGVPPQIDRAHWQRRRRAKDLNGLAAGKEVHHERG